MSNQEWLKLIESKREELLQAGEQAFKDSVDNQHLRYIVELYNDGSIDVWYDIAGGNSFSVASHKGDSMEVMHFCNQYLEINNQDDETEEEWLEWYKSEYAYQEADDKLDAMKDNLRSSY